MFGKLTCLALAIALLIAPVSATPQHEKQSDEQTRQIEKIRTIVYKIGEGPDARVTVKLRDNTRLKGYIRESGEDYLIVREPESGKTTRIEYAQVAEVKGRREFHVSPFFIRTALVAGAIAITAAIVASQTSRNREPKTVVFSAR
jgi:hypothetical protein